MVFVSGVMYVSSLKYCEADRQKCDEQVQKGINVVVKSQQLTAESTLLTYLTAFLYSFLHSSRQSVLSLSFLSTWFLVLFPRILLISFIHSLSLLTTATLNKSCFILFRSLFLSLTKSKLSPTPYSHIDDLIASLSTALGLLTLAEGAARFIVTPSSLPLLLLSFLPFYPSQLGDESLLPEVIHFLHFSSSSSDSASDSVRSIALSPSFTDPSVSFMTLKFDFNLMMVILRLLLLLQ